MKVISNYHKRSFKYGYEVPDEVHEDYDYLDENTRVDRWIRYEDKWFHLSDFLVVSKVLGELAEKKGAWDGIYNESFFSAILIRLVDDGESYIIGKVLS